MDVTRQGDIPISRYEFDEMATSLEEQLRKEIPLINVRVARFVETCIDGRLSAFLVVGEVTINGREFRNTIPVAIETRRAWRTRSSHPVDFLIDRMANAIAKAIVEWRPKETS